MGEQDWRRRLIVGMTGASGAIYGVRLLQVCRELGLEAHLCMSKAAELTLSYELDLRAAEVKALAHKAYAPGDVGAAIASGSFRTRGMIIAPCSIRTMAEIATGATSSALTRAADVVLKERRPLVLMLRETPLHAGHLENLLSSPASARSSRRRSRPSTSSPNRSTSWSTTRSAACSTCSRSRPTSPTAGARQKTEGGGGRRRGLPSRLLARYSSPMQLA